jgi:hypothetical protein
MVMDLEVMYLWNITTDTDVLSLYPLLSAVRFGVMMCLVVAAGLHTLSASFPHSLSAHLLTFQAAPVLPCPLLQYIQEVWGFIIVIMGKGAG